jgi:hypothetical protein
VLYLTALVLIGVYFWWAGRDSTIPPRHQARLRRKGRPRSE